MRFLWLDMAMLAAAIAALFVLIPRFKPQNKFGAALIVVAAALLTVTNIYLKANTGYGLDDRVVCVVYPSGQWCKEELAPATSGPTESAAPLEPAKDSTDSERPTGAVEAPSASQPPAKSAPDEAALITTEEIETVFRAYLAAWQAGDVPAQSALLDESFTYIDQENVRQSRSAYLRQKQELAAKYGASASSGTIRIDASNIHIETDGASGSVTYDQTYESPYYSSFGRNKFVIRKRNGVAKIVEEIFRRERFSRHQP